MRSRVGLPARWSLEPVMERLRRGAIHWCRTADDGETAALVLLGPSLVRLNRVAAAVWEEIERVPDGGILFRRMRRRFHGVEDRRLRADLDALIEGWLRSGVLVRQADPVFAFPEVWWPA